jgi:hypothetical protein
MQRQVDTARRTGPFPLTLVFDDSEHSMRFHSLYQNRERTVEAFNKGVAAITFADDRLVAAVRAADLFACAVSKESHKPPGTWLELEQSPFANIMNAPADPAYGKLYRAEHWDKATIEKHRRGSARRRPGIDAHDVLLVADRDASDHRGGVRRDSADRG